MELRQMKLMEMKMTQTETTLTPMRSQDTAHVTPPFFARATARLRAFGRSLIAGARSKRKALAVRETTAIGDRRFVSVIQFERRRFLIGSSPSSITLLARLPDESAAEESQVENGEKD